MARRTKNQNTLYVGEWNTDCDVCGFKHKASDLRKRWDGLMVCRDDFEERHPSDFVRAKPDNQNVPWTRPVQNPVVMEYNGDEGKALTSGSVTIQDWNTDMTFTRVIRLDVTTAKIGDRFTIYKTADTDEKLVITSKILDSGITV